MSEYRTIMSNQVKRRLKLLYVAGLLLIVLFAVQELFSIYLGYLKSAQRQVNNELNVVNKLRIEKELIREVLSEFKKVAYFQENQEQTVALLYRTFDEISVSVRPLTVEMGQMKSEGAIKSLGTVIKGTVRSFETVRLLVALLENLYYPFFKIQSIDLKYKDKEMDIAISGEIIIYSLDHELVREN